MIHRGFLFTMFSLICLEFYTAYSLTRETTLIRDTDGQCQAIQLGPSWTSPSPLACFAVCKLLYSSDCNSLVFNDTTQTCVPASRAFSPVDTYTSFTLDKNSGGEFYYSYPSPACNAASLGFVQYDLCGTSACLYIPSTNGNYQAALDECASRNATLFVANTLEKFSLFWTVSLNTIKDNTFIGLTDSVLEGNFTWVNGDSLSSEQATYIWASNQPDNNGGREDCVEARHRNWPGTYGLNDVPCSHVKRFICEFKP